MKKGLIIGGGAAAAALAGVAVLGSGGTCSVTSATANPHIFTETGELDYGFQLAVTIGMEGTGREVEVNGLLQTQAGDYTKSLSVMLEDGQQRTVTLPFPEPVLGQVVDSASATCS